MWWTAAGKPLNGFDAALWLLCFFAVEGNILEHENAKPARCRRPGSAPKGTTLLAGVPNAASVGKR